MNYEAFAPTQEKEAQAKNFDVYASELLADTQLQELSGEDRGKVILDRFIGAAVRHGNIEGSKASYTPADLLDGMDEVSRSGAEAFREITGTDGARKAVFALFQDEDVAKLFAGITGRLGQETRGGYILTSPAQVEGYLLSGGEKNYINNPVGGVDMHGDSWVPVIAGEMQYALDNPTLAWKTTQEARDMTTFSSPSIRNSGLDWLKASSSAKKAGVDVDLIGRSVEKMQDRINADHDMGAIAISSALGFRVQEYKLDHRRRSQR